jgi:translation initiation factor IF-3
MIRASEVRLVAEDGEQLGIQVLKDAMDIAANAGLDLVEVAPTAKPPVCRLMDYGKYKYLMSKKATEAKKKQTVIHVKEIKLRSKTEEHDLQFKLKNIIKFLTAGDKVKVTMVFRGREITHTELGLKRLKWIMEEIKEVGTIEQTPRLEGRSMNMVIAPLAKKD